MIEEKVYRIESNKIEMYVNAENIKDAWRKFFHKVINEGLVKDIGMMALLYDGDKVYAMRTVPALYAAGVISFEMAVGNIQHHIGVDTGTAIQMLKMCSEADRWAVDFSKLHMKIE